MSPSPHKALLGLLAFCVIAVSASRVPWMDREIYNLDEGVTYTLAQQVLAEDVWGKCSKTPSKYHIT